MLPLFVITIFLGSALLFLVQPLIAKAVLPLLGGSPAVWNTAMVFFQGALLAGYGYAHALARARPRAQLTIHALVALGTLALLPIALPAWEPPAAAWPVFWLLGALTVAVGGPFFVLAANAPLLQFWFSQTTHLRARDPYFLYAASNAGSLLALLAYPLLLEPTVGLAGQRVAWSIAFGVFVALMLTCRVVAGRERAPHPEEASTPAPPDPDEGAPPLTWRRRLLWLVLAAVPSSLLLGATQYVTTDVAAVPLLWVVPLAIYLATFILAFSPRNRIGLDSIARLLPIVAIAIAVAFLLDARRPIAVLTAIHLLGLFLACLLCHTRLANDRPRATHLTEFYLLIALGGVLGGSFNALLAPVLFDVFAEYPIAVALACALIPRKPPRADEPKAEGIRRRVLDLALPAVLIGAMFWADWEFERAGIIGGVLIEIVLVGVPALACYAMSRRPPRFALAIAGLMLFGILDPDFGERTLLRTRTFFGVHTVTRTGTALGPALRLRHGTTAHGVQSETGTDRREPTLYYTREGPLGDVFRELRSRGEPLHVGAVGMGVGAVAGYARPGDRFTFYEIDPEVIWIARDWGRFTYLPGAPAGTIDVVVGDARLKLTDAPDDSYDLIVLDAFTSDAIPAHLLTVEALRVYLDKLAPGGLLAFHLSNQHLDLTSVVRGIAEAEGLPVRVRVDSPDPGPPPLLHHRVPSTWAIVAREAADLGGLRTSGEWLATAPDAPTRLWTDDYSDIFTILRWF